VTAVNGHVQLSGVNQADGYKVMSEKSLRNNYKLVALDEKKAETVAAPAMDQPAAPELTPAPANDAPPVEQPADKAGRAAGGRVQLKDGTVTAGSKFIIEVCKLTREESYKADSPIRWLLKPAGQALLKEHEAQIVYGEKITK
jgi:hypothetical protein